LTESYFTLKKIDLCLSVFQILAGITKPEMLSRFVNVKGDVLCTLVGVSGRYPETQQSSALPVPWPGWQNPIVGFD
jgi:hypothetical protein